MEKKAALSNRLRDMRNLGDVSERQLKEIDILTPEDLRSVGSIEAWHRLKFVFGKQISKNFLYAMEGAIRDCDWRSLPDDVKQKLLADIDASPA